MIWSPNNLRIALSSLALTLCTLSAAWADEPNAEEFFEKRVRPILAGTCFRCHGGQQEGGSLRIDSREALLHGGDSGPAIETDKPEQSLLLKAILRDDDVSAMPPDKPLTKQQVADLTAWVKAGAPWPKKVVRFEAAPHWAFQPLTAPALPEVKDQRWVQTNVDRFILSRLEREQRKPMPAADRRTLLRRVTYDLTGLPPTPEEVAAFEADSSPRAFETVVERLLSSPHYGEQWGRHWLDVVRYADTAGENSDHPLPHAWRYRNWVINAINNDVPYDTFLREQIAGDLIAKEGPLELASDRIVATGYLAIARRFGHDIDKDMHLTLEDTLDTLGKSVLGLSIGCCRCHDHKYDPLSTRDYYGLYGIFESTRFAFPGCEPQQQPRDLVPLVLDQASTDRLRSIDGQVAVIDQELTQLNADLTAATKTLQAAAQATTVLSQGQIDDGKFAEIEIGRKLALDKHAIKRGEVLQLSIAPLGNHGADTTLVELEIAEVGGQQPRWSLADLISDLPAGNPHADAHGNADVWCFLDMLNGPRLLPERLTEISGQKSLQGWRNSDTPAVIANAGTEPVKVWTELPPRSLFMHPGPQGPVAVAWISPIDGEIAIRGRIADAHPSGPDGVSWQLEHFTSLDVGRGLIGLTQNRGKLT
ncbi:MAG TPA: DUF1549 domain-containing protein, partial [Pirellulaceae bacterium]|nr:DUF1549 domain-containing protein [Pirellulaceae bacterium]